MDVIAQIKLVAWIQAEVCSLQRYFDSASSSQYRLKIVSKNDAIYPLKAYAEKLDACLRIIRGLREAIHPFATSLLHASAESVPLPPDY